MSEFDIEIINYFENNELVAEIYFDSVQWAEILRKNDKLIIKFYSNPDKEYWEFPAEEAIKTLKQAKTKLLARISTGGFFQEDIPINPKQVNEQGQTVLENILNHPDKVVKQYNHCRYGPVIEIEAPGLGGVRFTGDGKEMKGFLEPYWLKK